MNRIILNETSYFGAGCRSVIAVEAARRGFKKAFFVTDKDLIKFGVAAEIIKVFDENQIPYELYSDVKANPTIANVQTVWQLTKLPEPILSLLWVVALLSILPKESVLL